MTITITAPDKSDVRQILYLLSRNDPARATFFNEKYYWWQFVEIPGGPAIQMVAKDNGNVVGFGALLPFTFIIAGKQQTVYEGVEFVVAPEYRGKGIFTRLASQLYGKIGDSCAFAFASPMSFNTYQTRLGHRFVGYFPYWFGIAEIYPTLKKKIGFLAIFIKPLLKSVSLRKIPKAETITIQPIKTFNSAWETVECWRYDATIYAHKNRRFLNWRYFNHPSNSYDVFGAFAENTPVGYIVVRQANLVDIGFSSPDIAESLLNTANDYFYKNKFPLCHTYVCPTSKIRVLLKRQRLYNANCLQHNTFANFIYPRQRFLVKGDCLNICSFESLFFTMADLDCKL